MSPAPSPSMRRALALLLCGATLLGSSAAGRSVGSRDEAVLHARQARQHYDQGEYRQAIVGFEKAFAIVGRAELLFNVADCYERLGEMDKAIDYYRRYLARCAPEQRDQVSRLIAAILKRPSRLRVETRPSGARVWIDGRPFGDPTPAQTTVPPGSVTVRLELPGHRPHQETLVARHGVPLTLLVTLQRLPARGPPGAGPAAGNASPGARPEPWRRSAGFVGLAAGLKKPLWAGVDQPRLNYSVTLTGGYGLLLTERARLELGVRLFLSTIDDGNILTLLDVSALSGLRIRLVQRLYAFVRAGLGVATIHGVKWDTFFFSGDYQPNDQVPASYASVHLWGALGLGYRIWRGVSLELTPASVDFVQPVGFLKEDASELKYIFRYNLHLGILVDI